MAFMGGAGAVCIGMTSSPILPALRGAGCLHAGALPMVLSINRY
jgi:hypothetical protein